MRAILHSTVVLWADLGYRLQQSASACCTLGRAVAPCARHCFAPSVDRRPSPRPARGRNTRARNFILRVVDDRDARTDRVSAREACFSASRVSRESPAVRAMANDSPTHSGVSADRWLAKAFGETSVSGGARSARSDGGVRDSRASIRSEVRDAWRFKRLKNLKMSSRLSRVCLRA